jgi:hypothetical protein
MGNFEGIILLTSFQKVTTVHKEVQRVLLGKLYALSDDVVEVVCSEIVRDQIPKVKNKFRFILLNTIYYREQYFPSNIGGCLMPDENLIILT